MEGLTAQSCESTIRGRIYDEHDRSGLELSSIIIMGTDQGSLTDSLGNYIIRNVCPGTITLKVTHIDCEEIIRKITVDKGVIQLDIALEHHVRQLDQVNIQAKSNKRPVAPHEKINRTELNLSKNGTLTENLRSISGVNSLTTGPNIEKPIIHGMFGSRIGILVEGSKVEDQQWGSEHAPSVNLLLFDDVEVVKGVSAIRYGAKSLGGTIVIEPSIPYTGQQLDGTIHLGASTNAPGGSISLELARGFRAQDKGGWKLAAGITRYGDSHAPDFVLSNTGGENVSAGFMCTFLQDKWFHRITLMTQYTSSALLLSTQIGSQADLEHALELSRPTIIRPFTFGIAPPSQKVLHTSAIYNNSYRLNANQIIRLNGSFQWNNRKEFDIRRGGRSNIPAVNMDLLTTQLEIVEDHTWSNAFSGQWGMAFMHQHNQNDNKTDRFPLIPWYHQINGGLFIIEKWYHKNIIAEVGGRGDFTNYYSIYYTLTNDLITDRKKYFNGTFSASIRYQNHSGLIFTFNSGMGFRPPDINELYSNGVHISAASYEVGNPSLRSERALKTILSIEKNNLNRLSFVANIYHNSVQNFIYLRPEGSIITIAGAKLKYQYTQSDAQFFGADVSTKFILTPALLIEEKADYLYAVNKTTKMGLPMIPPFSNRLSLTWSINKSITNKSHYDFSVNWGYTARQKRYDEADVFSPPPAEYHLFGLGTRYKSRNNKLILDLELKNIFNIAYSNYLDRLRYFSKSESGRSLSLKILFNFQS